MQGEFQFLGELYFPDDKKGNKSRILKIDVLTKEVAPDTLRVLLFDNQPSSFGMVCLCDLDQYDNKICTQQCYWVASAYVFFPFYHLLWFLVLINRRIAY